MVECLVRRDDQILRLIANGVVPGPAFRGAQSSSSADESDLEDDDTQVQAAKETSLPQGISQRMHNLFLLNIDMQGKLTKWIEEAQ